MTSTRECGANNLCALKNLLLSLPPPDIRIPPFSCRLLASFIKLSTNLTECIGNLSQFCLKLATLLPFCPCSINLDTKFITLRLDLHQLLVQAFRV